MDSVHPLRRYRLRRKLTVEALAGRLGVSKPTLSRWETGTRRPRSRKHLKKIENVTGIMPEAVIMFEHKGRG